MKRFSCLLLALIIAVGVCFSAPMTVKVSAAEAGTTVSNPIVLREGIKHTKVWTSENDDLNCYNKIVLPQDGYIYFDIYKTYDNEGEIGSYYLELYKPNGDIAWHGDASAQVSTFKDSFGFNIGLAKGTYYMNLVPSFYVYRDSAPIATEYYYRFYAANDWEKEPNSNASQATPLKMGQFTSAVFREESHKYTFADYFSIRLTKGGEYQLDIDHYIDLEEGTTLIDMLDSSGNKINIGREKESGNIGYWDFVAPKTDTYYVKIYNDFGKEGTFYRVGVFAMVKSLATPTAKVSNTAKGIKVSWNEIANASKYVVYQRYYNASSKQWSGWKAIKSTTSRSYVDTSAIPGVNYRYAVRAVTGNIKSKYKSTGTIKYNFAPTVKVTNASNGVKVSWSTIANATGYTVYSSSYNEKTKKWSGWKNRGTAAASKTSWVDKNVKSGGAYKYTVRAVRGSYKTSYNKSGVSVRFLSQPTVKIASAGNGVKVSWTKVAGSKGYAIYRSQLSNGSWTGWKKMGTAASNKTAWVDKSASGGKTYRYTARAVSGKHMSTYKSSSSLFYMAAPVVTLENERDGMRVNWTSCSGAQGYHVYRSVYNGNTGVWSGWSLLATTSNNMRSFIDKDVKVGIYYKYTVRGYSGSNKGAFVSSDYLERQIPPCEHEYNEATCTEPATCIYCGNTIGSPYGHSFYEGYCEECGIKDPDYVEPEIVPHVTLSNEREGMRVNWTSCSGVQGYCVYRSIYNGHTGVWSDWELLTTTNRTTYTYLDKTVNVGIYYKYTVTGYDSYGETGFESSDYLERQIPACTHSYSSATCTSPKTCIYCGETTGSALGHSYNNATCTSPKTCSRCGTTTGSALGHTYTAATCTSPRKCTRCGTTTGSALGHSYSGGYYGRCGATDPSYNQSSYDRLVAFIKAKGQLTSNGAYYRLTRKTYSSNYEYETE
ncbi:MAG: hypothetical protein IKC01_08015, partial [Clostridia bacterium]|nr:hypothetical protein [Clostridia bacterium]